MSVWTTLEGSVKVSVNISLKKQLSDILDGIEFDLTIFHTSKRDGSSWYGSEIRLAIREDFLEVTPYIKQWVDTLYGANLEISSGIVC